MSIDNLNLNKNLNKKNIDKDHDNKKIESTENKNQNNINSLKDRFIEDRFIEDGFVEDGFVVNQFEIYLMDTVVFKDEPMINFDRNMDDRGFYIEAKPMINFDRNVDDRGFYVSDRLGNRPTRIVNDNFEELISEIDSEGESEGDGNYVIVNDGESGSESNNVRGNKSSNGSGNGSGNQSDNGNSNVNSNGNSNRNAERNGNRVSREVKVESNVEAKGEVEVSRNHVRVSGSVGANGSAGLKETNERNGNRVSREVKLESNVEARGEAEVSRNYVGVGGSVSAGVSVGSKVTGEINGNSVSVGSGFGVEAGTQAEIKLGANTRREGDEIVSKAGIYGAARSQANYGVYATAEARNSDGYISGKLSVQGGEGVGGAAGGYSEARINTNTWNVKFHTFAELDIGLILEAGVSLDLEGETNISNEVNQIRQDLINHLREEENRQVRQQMSNHVKSNRNNNANNIGNNVTNNISNSMSTSNKMSKEDRKKILENIPGWKSKLNIIKYGIKEKIRNIMVGFAKSSNEKLKQLIERRMGNSWLGKAAKSVVKGLDKITDFQGFILSRVLYNLFPRIESAVNEIKPTDILKV